MMIQLMNEGTHESRLNQQRIDVCRGGYGSSEWILAFLLHFFPFDISLSCMHLGCASNLGGVVLAFYPFVCSKVSLSFCFI